MVGGTGSSKNRLWWFLSKLYSSRSKYLFTGLQEIVPLLRGPVNLSSSAELRQITIVQACPRIKFRIKALLLYWASNPFWKLWGWPVYHFAPFSPYAVGMPGFLSFWEYRPGKQQRQPTPDAVPTGTAHWADHVLWPAVRLLTKLQPFARGSYDKLTHPEFERGESE